MGDQDEVASYGLDHVFAGRPLSYLTKNSLTLDLKASMKTSRQDHKRAALDGGIDSVVPK
jgi:hypothetical protein